MKHTIVVFGLVLALAACGGGGSTGGGFTPNPGPSATPTLTPSPQPTRGVAYTWTGNLHPSSTTTARSMITGSAGDPVMDGICDPQVEAPGCTGYVQPQIDVVETGVSPQPSTAPTVSPPPNVHASPDPKGKPFTYDLSPLVGVSPGPMKIHVQFADGTKGDIPLNAYAYVNVGCTGSGTIGSMPAGWSFDNNAPSTTIAGSDIYITGPNCPGEFADPSAPTNGYTLHTPFGATAYAFTSIDFATVSSSMITSPQTSWQISGPYGVFSNGFLIGHTKSGGTFALVFQEDWNNGPNPPYTDGDYFSADYKYATMGQPFLY